MGKELKQGLPEYITTGFIAKRCGISRVTALRWIEKDLLPAFKLPDKHCRISRGDFIKFLTRYGIPVQDDMFGHEDQINTRTRRKSLKKKEKL